MLVATRTKRVRWKAYANVKVAILERGTTAGRIRAHDVPDIPDARKPLCVRDVAHCRNIAGVNIYVSNDRCDIPYAAKRLRREKSAPRTASEARRKKALRHLRGAGCETFGNQVCTAYDVSMLDVDS